jgi:solute carrier family 25 iron transporter 28/37
MSSSEELDWEEWDGKSPFWHHCVAGSAAGVAEHVLVYPLDTGKYRY